MISRRRTRNRLFLNCPTVYIPRIHARSLHAMNMRSITHIDMPAGFFRPIRGIHECIRLSGNLNLPKQRQKQAKCRFTAHQKYIAAALAGRKMLKALCCDEGLCSQGVGHISGCHSHHRRKKWRQVTPVRDRPSRKRHNSRDAKRTCASTTHKLAGERERERESENPHDTTIVYDLDLASISPAAKSAHKITSHNGTQQIHFSARACPAQSAKSTRL